MRDREASKTKIDQRKGFTLIEVLVVIVIIGILAALLIPAITGAVAKAKQTAIAMEIEQLSQALELYNSQYGDYPPDFSDSSVVSRHFSKIFPNIASSDLSALTTMMQDSSGNVSPIGIDRAEALIITLGGYSSDKRHPLTGPGGPFIVAANGTVSYNYDRENALFDFETNRLIQNNFEGTDSNGGAMPNDGIPVLVPSGRQQPYVYFDARSYTLSQSASAVVANGYIGSNNAGGIRPYKTSTNPVAPPSGGTYGSKQAAYAAYKFQKPKSFQIISAGLDDIYGALTFTPNGDPIHYVSEFGVPVYPNDSANTPLETRYLTISGFQESTVSPENVNGHLDNITNFSEGILENSLQEMAP